MDFFSAVDDSLTHRVQFLRSTLCALCKFIVEMPSFPVKANKQSKESSKLATFSLLLARTYMNAPGADEHG
jgi:hypothetical protein